MFCTRCGAENGSEARYCMKCGSAFSAGVVRQAPPSRPPVERPPWITVIAVFHFILDPLLAIAGGVLILDPDSGRDQPYDVGLGSLIFLVAVIGMIAGIGLLQGKAYGRRIQIVLSILGLLLFPIGTIINGIVLWYLFTPAVKTIYSGARPIHRKAPELLPLLRAGVSVAPIAIVILAACIGLAGIVGIIASLAVPNVHAAMQRSKQKQTVADMRSIGTSIERYVADHKRLPQADDIAGLQSQVAQYASVVSSDGWAQPIRFGTDGESYWLISAGRDGRFENEDPRDYSEGTIATFDNDIVFMNGKFVQYPEEAVP